MMGFSRESAVERAKRDLAVRVGVEESSITDDVAERDFPDMALGAAEAGEMAAQMISSGWQINLKVDGKPYEYRADKYQLRLVDFKGRNHVIK